MIKYLWSLLKSKFLKVRFGSSPKYIRVGTDIDVYDIPCYKAVVNYLKANQEFVDEFLEKGRYELANTLVFGHLKYYVSGLGKYDGVPNDLSEVIKYIYDNLE